MLIVFFTLSGSFTCFLLISHLKSYFYFWPAELSDFCFDTLYEILHKRIWQQILDPCPIFGYLIHFWARSKTFLQFFFHLSPIYFNWPKFRTIWWVVVFLQKWVFSALYHCWDRFFIMIFCKIHPDDSVDIQCYLKNGNTVSTRFCPM